MGEVCRWCGIKIIIRFREDDRHEPHFHVKCAETAASISIADGKVYASTLSPRDLKDVLGWAADHRNELMDAWTEIKAGRSPGQIEP
jgi:Domain of unknown function (DUF4160)